MRLWGRTWTWTFGRGETFGEGDPPPLRAAGEGFGGRHLHVWRSSPSTTNQNLRSLSSPSHPSHVDAHKPNQDTLSVSEGFAGRNQDGFFGVYDGHGRDGDKCAQYARDRLPDLLTGYLQRARAREADERTRAAAAAAKKKDASSSSSSSSSAPPPPPVAPADVELTRDWVRICSLKAHVECNRALHRCAEVDDSLSGTTAITAYVQGGTNRITVSNLGDSRAIVGQRVRRQQSGGGGGTERAAASASAGAGAGAGTKGGGRRGGGGPGESSGGVDGGGSGSGNVGGMNGGNEGGEKSALRALPLSRDQTPYRRDERIRVRRAGGRILSLDQIEGLEPINPNDELEEEQGGADGGAKGDLVLGEEIDEGGDPPRVWSPHGEYPGTAFTRSIGDAIAEELGVYAEPEMVTRELGPDDKIVVLASDGVFEFLTNQSVIDLCAKFDDPLAACRAVVAESYELWLQYELRTDDITMICMFIDGVEPQAKAARSSYGPAGGSALPASEVPAEAGRGGGGNDGTDGVLPSKGNRPVRTSVSKAKMEAIQKSKERMIAGGDTSGVQAKNFDVASLYTEKSQEEKEAIDRAIHASVMFEKITDEQRDLIYKVIQPISVKAGECVIKQGSMGDCFYIVDDGKFEVRIVPDGEEDTDGTGGNVVHVYEGSREEQLHPSFGELALMYSAPRAASIIAQTDGHLLELHRFAFQKVLGNVGSKIPPSEGENA